MLDELIARNHTPELMKKYGAQLHAMTRPNFIEAEAIQPENEFVCETRCRAPAPVVRHVFRIAFRVHLATGARKQEESTVGAVAIGVLLTPGNASVHDVPGVDGVVDFERDIVLALLAGSCKRIASGIQTIANIEAIGERGAGNQSLNGFIQAQAKRVVGDDIVRLDVDSRNHRAAPID